MDAEVLRPPFVPLLAPLEATASVSESVGNVLELIVSFCPLISDCFEAVVEEDSRRVCLQLNHPHDGVDQGRTTEAVLWMFKRCVLDHLGVRSVVDRGSGLGVSKVALVLSREEMGYKPIGSNPRAYDAFHDAFSRYLVERLPPKDGAELERIVQAIEQNAAIGVFSAVAAARRAHLSLRTAQRIVWARGSSLRLEIDALRRQKAIGYVEDGRWEPDEIAERLGYSDERAFRRAFHRWTGTTPSSYRSGRIR
ncbi:MAG: AraC family transcriptional regulator [Myxococcota bacterium]